MATLELDGFQDDFDGDFGLIPLSSLLANSYQFFVVWQGLARVSITCQTRPMTPILTGIYMPYEIILQTHWYIHMKHKHFYSEAISRRSQFSCRAITILCVLSGICWCWLAVSCDIVLLKMTSSIKFLQSYECHPLKLNAKTRASNYWYCYPSCIICNEKNRKKALWEIENTWNRLSNLVEFLVCIIYRNLMRLGFWREKFVRM